MLHQLVQASDAHREAGRAGRLDGSLMPAMYGCPECRTAWVIVAPIPLALCDGCGAPLAVLSASGLPRGAQ